MPYRVSLRGGRLMAEVAGVADSQVVRLKDDSKRPKRSDAEIRAELDDVFSEVYHDDLMLKIKAAAYAHLVKRNG